MEAVNKQIIFKTEIARDAPTGASQESFMPFYYIYVLKSISENFIYIGFTLSLKNRLSYHNSLKVTSTKDYAPLELIHYEAYRNKKDAIRREKYLKSTKGKTTLKTMLKEYFSKAVLVASS